MKPLKSILLIDDDDNFNYLHMRLLTKMNVAHHVEIVTNGQQALDFLISQNELKKEYPDLIFLDIDMPIMDGWSFLLEYEMLIRKVFSKSVLAMFTSNGDEAIRKKALSIDFVNIFFVKPLTTSDINYILDKYFTNSPVIA
ncbi:response regulator [Fulvivirga kasyanovii]|uniref:Response regulator n=1 Tax=Fulvivirga kasyanovii TaxID=396812 RepID=A0ABW9RI13_9BACT|nr:response regulator [Fulvivirga kasyanovii]MTI23616.1 response regulator [Fulvivirga kasyanovii]